MVTHSLHFSLILCHSSRFVRFSTFYSFLHYGYPEWWCWLLLLFNEKMFQCHDSSHFSPFSTVLCAVFLSLLFFINLFSSNKLGLMVFMRKQQTKSQITSNVSIWFVRGDIFVDNENNIFKWREKIYLVISCSGIWLLLSKSCSRPEKVSAQT